MAALQSMVQVFLSYAHADTERLDAFLTRLDPVRRSQDFQIWDDRALRAGELWDQAIQKAVRDSDIFLCLVTSHFLASRYIRDSELPAILKAQQSRRALVIPIILETCYWDDVFAERQCVPLTRRGQLRPIVNWRPRNDGYHAASVQIARSITDYLDREPPPTAAPGPSLIATPEGFEIADDAPSPAERRDPTQQALLERLKARLDRFAGPLAQRCGNSHRTLCDEFAIYQSFAAAPIDALNIGALVDAGTALSSLVKRLTPPLPAGVMSEALEPDILAELETILTAHARLIMGFAEGRDLVQRVAVFAAQIDKPAERAAETRNILAPMRETKGLLAPQAKTLVASLEGSIAVASQQGLEALATGIQTGGRFLGDIARVIARVCNSAAGPLTVVTIGSAMAGNPSLTAYHAALTFLTHSAQPILAFAASQDEFRRLLQWTMEEIGKRRRPVFATEGSVSAAQGDAAEQEPPPDFDMDEVKRMILRGEAPPERWVPWITRLYMSLETELRDLAPVANLQNLQTLFCSGTQITDLQPLGNLQSLQTLGCYHTQITDLQPLENLQSLQILVCSGTQISDLRPLEHLQNLRTLDCSGTQISDLQPLEKLWNLGTLFCSGTQITDLRPLEHLQNLQTLDCSYTQISDLQPLGNLQNLRTLGCSGTQITDLQPLQKLQNLQTLDCSRTQVTDLQPLEKLRNLQTLTCYGTQINDLQPLRNLQSLQTLDCSGTQISDLQPLEKLQSLQTLDCSHTQLRDLQPVTNVRDLESFDCSFTQISDLRPVASLQSLQNLMCSRTRVSDLDPLANLQSLKSLNCSATRVRDLNALKNLQSLRSLRCTRTQVSDLKPVGSLQSLQSLKCSYTQVSDLRPIADLRHIRDLDCSYTQISNLQPIAALTSLRTLAVANCNLTALPSEFPASLKELVLLDSVWPRGRSLPDVPYRIDFDGTVHDPDGKASDVFNFWSRQARNRKA
ncbi:leucine-rich repeat domain-containing protein [Jiella sp. MQZ9-1]|uniref:Leucine-rich repeat domain-containing protein n=1 Tax=Jiella flava TaxID=2816857 RepID=A0A939G2E5_9HYPH|nr:leucine-rich repeat domain-containing protein [Jiella flava]MBO0663962.1 leucine-rich repeat domain-containing protein [Jiella flava]MCD2472533.1 leucine-rich repeat domain-containing protein [Jiella flava]